MSGVQGKGKRQREQTKIKEILLKLRKRFFTVKEIECFEQPGFLVLRDIPNQGGHSLEHSALVNPTLS